MTAKALLVASYGTASTSAWARSLDQLTSDLAAAFPDRELAFSCEGKGVRRLLEARREPLPSTVDALGQLASTGVEDVLVCCAVVSAGRTLESIGHAALASAPLFAALHLSEPLLATERDACELASVLDAHHPRTEGIFHLLVGHGSGIQADVMLGSVQHAFERLGRDDMATTTLRERAGLPALLETLPYGVRKVRIVPLTFFAGAHVRKELAGLEESSWASLVAASGFEVSCAQEGLAELPGVRSIFVRHAQVARPPA